MRLKSEQIKDDEKRLRVLMREKFGTGKYRITANGEVHVYGRAPNSIEVCWWLFGQDQEDALFRLTGE